ncbi:hypothetical protein ACIBG0_41710 [Nocardia sp. NPDC050630]|uniref:hypothetical protein n=1 Tax=Nocardia sp. NPDC050630 TaxID=3364321 RepID=UPI00379F73AA
MSFGTRYELESPESLRQSERVASSLRQAGFDAETILNALREPVAVKVLGVFSAADAAPIVASAADNGRDEAKRINNDELGDVIPYGTRSGEVYPYRVCQVIDVAVRAIMARYDIAGTRMHGPEGGLAIDIGDAHPHTDFPGSAADAPIDDVHGFNVHVTLCGKGVVRFSPVRSFARVQNIASTIRIAQREGRSIVEINETFPELYADVMASAGDPVSHQVGDVLLFQSRPHRSKGLLPMVHHFESRTDDRWHNVFVPKAGNRDEINIRRARVIDLYHLEKLGYTTLPDRAG